MKHILMFFLLTIISCIHGTAKKADMSSCYSYQDIDAIAVKFDSILVDFENNNLFISGWIYDSAMNEQLVDADVFIKKDFNVVNVRTDLNGFFKLDYNGSLEETKFIVSYVGYKDFQVSIKEILKKD